MTRQRLHYQGLLKAKVPNADSLIQDLKTVWQGILQSQYTAVPLSAFLDPENSSSGYVRDQAAVAAQHVPTAMKNKDEWTRLHQRIMEPHQVGLRALYVFQQP